MKNYLLQRINKFFPIPVTVMSCQHNWFGYDSIAFDYIGYYKFYHKVRNQYLSKLGIENEDETHIVTGFYARLVEPTKYECNFTFNPQITTSGGQQLTIRWDFNHSDIPQ